MGTNPPAAEINVRPHVHAIASQNNPLDRESKRGRQPYSPLAPVERLAPLLGVLSLLTREHRERIAARHDADARIAAAREVESFDAIGRTRPDFTELDLDWKRPSSRLPGGAPVWDSRTHVRRLRRKRHYYWDRKSRPRCETLKKAILVPAHEAHAASRAWHEARAVGQRTRAATAGACGDGTIEITCSCCGVVTSAPVWCGIVRLCEGCNERRAMRTRARFAKALEIVTWHAERHGSTQRWREGGPIGQKHIVFTMPHHEGDVFEVDSEGRKRLDRKATAARRIEILFNAWKRFSRELQAWQAEPWTGQKPAIGACWHRAFEWTAGSEGGDGCGHPHFHLWAMLPYLPEHDDHRVRTIEGGAAKRTRRCAAPRRLTKKRGAAWGWAETMRRERCTACVDPRPTAPVAVRGAWGWARTLAPSRRVDVAEGAWGFAARVARDRHLDAYYRAPRRADKTTPAVERRTGLRTWWADALAAEGARVDDQRVNISIQAARAQMLFREVHKPHGIRYRTEHVRRIEIVTSAGELVGYFEAPCLAFLDRKTLELAGPEVIAGVYEALEGRRLSQSSKVLLGGKDGGIVSKGFLGIAEEFIDGSCRDCSDVATHKGKPPPPSTSIPPKNIVVAAWHQGLKNRIGPKLAPSTGPPFELSGPERYAELLTKLRIEARPVPARARELEAILAEVRAGEGLPSYRRGGRARPGGKRPAARTWREKMKARK